MTKTLDVLVVGSDPTATEEAERTLGERRHDELRTGIRSQIARLAAAAGTSANEVTCHIEPTGTGLQVDLYVPVPVDRRMQQALGVRVLDAVHASGRTYGQVDVNVHEATG